MTQELTNNGLTVLFGTMATVLAVFQIGIMLIHRSSFVPAAEAIDGEAPSSLSVRSFNVFTLIRHVVKELLSTQLWINVQHFDFGFILSDPVRGHVLNDILWRVFSFRVEDIPGIIIESEEELDELAPV